MIKGHSTRALLAAATTLALAALLVVAPFNGHVAHSSAASETTLTTEMDSSGIDTLNPFLSYYNGALNTFGMIYPSLTALNSSGKAIPYLARSWTVSSDQKTWTFKIASGLKWSDGKPLTAKDAAWTIHLIMTNDTAGTANGSLVQNFESVSAPNDTTLVITTKQPQANMLYVSIPIYGIPIVPEHIWSKHVSNLKSYKNTSYPIVGYGPWTLTGYTTDQYESFTANHDWSNGNQKGPKFDKLVVRQFKNSDAAAAALKSGQLSMLDISAAQYKTLRKTSSISTYRTPGNGWTGVEINAGAKTTTGQTMGTANSSLADPTVRKAIHMAIDKQKLVDNVKRGQALVAHGYLPPAWSQWTWTPSASEKVNFDTAAANKLLDDAGYAKGSDGIRVDPKTKKPLSFRLGTHSDDSEDAAVAAMLKGWMNEIGIKLTIQPMSMSMLNSNLGKGDWDLLMDGWTTGPDPSYLLSIQTCSSLPTSTSETGMTDAFFCDPAYDELYSKQETTIATAQRVSYVTQMQQILYKANQDIMLYYGNTLGAYRKDEVKNVPVGSTDSKGMYPSQNAYSLYLNAAPVKSNASSTGAIVGWSIGIAVVVIVGGGLVLLRLRRRKEADDRE
ncbi:MAG: ABC transporter substrate-binding protein [Pseudoclavibacter sp.]